ncbi:MAG: integrase, partial [Nitrososphaeria archaeon]
RRRMVPGTQISTTGCTPPCVPRDWRGSVNVGALSAESRRAILEAVRSKLGWSGALAALGISRAALSRYLSGQRAVPDDVVRRALGQLEEEEFLSAAGSAEALGSMGLVRGDGSIDYGLLSRALAVASRDEFARRLILEFAVRNFREELRRMLGISAAGVRLHWDEGFEAFLREGKRRRKVRTDRMIRYYRNLFARRLEGRELTPELVEEVAADGNGWLRNVFRHHAQYLYRRRLISPELFGWIMEAVPARSYHLDVRPYRVDEGEVRRTLEFLRENHRRYYLIYRLMLEGGLRLEHALRIAREFAPDEEVEVPGLDLPVRRLAEREGFARYYCGFRGSTKPCEWAYMSAETLRMLRELAPFRTTSDVVSRYARRHGLVLPKTMRKLSWRIMVSAVPREVARFLQSRLGELSVSEARYEDLLSEADAAYPRYLEALRARLGLRGGARPAP